jgi:SAM-dependent methyltransferase
VTAPPGARTFDEARYRPVFARQRDSRILREIWRSAYGDESTDELEPLSFVTMTDLRWIAREARVAPGELLVDLGCGRGGPTLWLARELGVEALGIDVVPEAVEEATRRRSDFGVEERVAFRVGTFADTGLQTASCSAVTSVDAFWMVLDKAAAAQEVARVLRPGGRFVMTTWEPEHQDHVELLEDAGFEVLLAEEPPGWHEPQLAVYRGILAREGALREELGDEAADVLVAEAREAPAALERERRLRVAAAAG